MPVSIAEENPGAPDKFRRLRLRKTGSTAVGRYVKRRLHSGKTACANNITRQDKDVSSIYDHFLEIGTIIVSKMPIESGRQPVVPATAITVQRLQLHTGCRRPASKSFGDGSVEVSPRLV